MTDAVSQVSKPLVEDAPPKRVHFHFRGLDADGAVRKSLDGGPEHRYLYGIASGPKQDGHGERMTEKCIQGFMDQAQSKDVLLFAGKHDVNFDADIGILTDAKVLENGDWWCEFRLYDSTDDVGASTIERADKVWAQVTGAGPYKQPKKLGFSVEGYVAPGGILSMSNDEKNPRRVLDHVVLDGVVLVPRPSYQDSIAHAVYKALGEWHPATEERIKTEVSGRLRTQLAQKDAKSNYYEQRCKLNDALDEIIEEYMTGNGFDKRRMVELALEEYAGLMADLVLSHPDAFEPKAPDSAPITEQPVRRSKPEVWKDLAKSVEALNRLRMKKV